MNGGLHAVQRWLARQPEGVELELVCVEHPGPARGDRARTVVRLATCIREVPAHEVVELLAIGAATVVVRTDGCSGPATATAHLGPAVEALAAAGRPQLRCVDADRPDSGDEPARGSAHGGKIRRRPRALRTRGPAVREVLDAAHMPVPRRQLLGLGAGLARELPDQLDSAPRRLNAALAALLPADARAGMGASPAVRLGARGCTACGVCVRACPTDALSLRSSGGEGASTMVTSLLQDPASCDGCTRCVDLCPADVLTVAGEWDWDAALTAVETPVLAPVVSLTTAQCGRCRTRFPTTDAATLCPVCTYRRANPFSSTLPPGMLPAVPPAA